MKNYWNPDLYQEKHAYVYKYGRQVIDWLNPKKGERILDAGCGTGQLTAEIAEMGCEVIGIDNSEEMIKTAKAKHPSLHFYKKDITNFSFENTFDAVFSNAVLHWVNDAHGAIQCFHKALRQEGRFVTEFGGENNIRRILNALKSSFQSRGIPFIKENGPWYFPSVAEYAYLLEKNGFLVKHIQHIDRPTVLASEKSGIRDLLCMFGSQLFLGLTEEQKELIMLETQEKVMDTNYINGKWIADYCRIRVEAVKKN